MDESSQPKLPKLHKFLELSAALTAHSPADLQGTGQLQAYFTVLQEIVGAEIVNDLLRTFRSIAEKGELHLEEDIRRHIMSSARFGPIARNIIKLWQLSTWYQLPQDYRERYGTNPNDITRLVSAEAYREGLVWKVMGTHPMGARQPGWGSWAFPPGDVALIESAAELKEFFIDEEKPS